MVITLLFQEAESPEGKPVTAPIPVAPVVVMVMGVSVLPAQSVGLEDGALAVLRGVTVMLPTAFTVPQPPVSGIL
jgi:hypothetical protein